VSSCHVGLVLVAHSARLAEGLADVAAEMAPDVPIRPAGGCLDGRLGTSYERVETAIKEVLAVDGVEAVVVLTDLGSAALTTDAVLEGLDDPRATWVDAPFVEGAVAAAVAAQTGESRDAVCRALRGVGASYARPAEAQPTVPGPGSLPAPLGRGEAAPAARPAPPAAEAASGDRAATRSRTLHLVNRLGLHARPAALLARTAGDFDAEVYLNGVAATSVLELMSLGLELGDELRLLAAGPEAGAALDAIEDLVDSRFGEE
jgi:PTS hybrid protein